MKYIIILLLTSSFIGAMEPATIKNDELIKEPTEYSTMPDNMTFLKYLRLKFTSDNAYYVKTNPVSSNTEKIKKNEPQKNKS